VLIRRSTFNLTLQRVWQNIEGRRVEAEGQAIRILLGVEQSLFRESIRSALDREPDLRVVAVAEDGRRAIEEAERATPDVAILSGSLRNLDPLAVTRFIRERVVGCRVLLLADAEDQAMLVASLEAGAAGFLSPDSQLTDLIDSTRGVFRGETFVPPSMLGGLLNRLMGRRAEMDRNAVLIARLTPREREVLAILSAGGNNETIAQTLIISTETARTHVQNVLTKLGVHSRLAAAAFARQNGLLETLPVFD
jgi:DNA-binding NarL/FixJ family response regulator